MEKILEHVTFAILAFITFFVIYYKWSFNYWKRKNVPCLETIIPFGNNSNTFLGRAKSFAELYKEHYDRFKSKGCAYGGVYLFFQPVYIPIHPDYIKSVLAKDFNHFMDHGFYSNEKSDPLSANLFSATGNKWKTLRTKLTPSFTTGKMKLIFDSMVTCGQELVEALDPYTSNTLPVDIHDLLSRFTVDVIGACVFGLECNSFKNPDAEFRLYGKKILQISRKDVMKRTFAMLFPNLAYKLNLSMSKPEVTKFFLTVVNDIVKYRENNDIRRDDFMQTLIDLKKKGDGQDGLTMSELAAQVYIFFFAGFETSSLTMTFCMLELAVNTNLQKKARDEINQVLGRHGGVVTYEALAEMKYMDAVIDETLRKYPGGPILIRKCTEPYKIPGANVTIDKDTRVMVSVLGIHHDPEYYPDPEKYDPERFSEENRKRGVPYTYIPFGDGPRYCIGQKFGLLQVKVGLVLLLKNYAFSLNPRTPYPVEYAGSVLALFPKELILLNVVKN